VWFAASNASYDRRGEDVTIAAPFETELSVFEEHRKEWSQSHLGKFVVIRDGTILNEFFDEYSAAFKAGLQAFGLVQIFLVRQIWIEEPVYFVA
jgi:hypothetical protein